MFLDFGVLYHHITYIIHNKHKDTMVFLYTVALSTASIILVNHHHSAYIILTTIIITALYYLKIYTNA